MSCEEVQMSAMALGDGETPPCSAEAIRAHVAQCSACRQELGEFDLLGQRWGAQSRRIHAADPWSAVEGRIRVRRRGAVSMFVLAAMLVIFKVIEFIPKSGLGMWVELVPLMLASAMFVLVRQNPFQIKTEIRSQEEFV